MGVLHCCANDAMRIMLIGRGYLPNREDYPLKALAAALPVHARAHALRRDAVTQGDALQQFVAGP